MRPPIEKTDAVVKLQMDGAKMMAAEAKARKTKSPADLKALDAATVVYEATAKIVRRERFDRVAGTRVTALIKEFKLLGNCSNLRAYDYSSEDMDKAMTTIITAYNECQKRFVDALNGEKSVAPVKKFTFS